jgi:diaminopimelate decarboxylase
MLAQRAGRTPFYAYDRNAMAERIAELRAAIPRSMRIHYAIKANPLPALVAHMAGLVDGFDVASDGELRVALQAGMPASRISFAGPGKTEAELAEAIRTDIGIHVESARELTDVYRLARTAGKRPRMALRVNPDFQLRSAGMKMGGGPAQFGIDSEEIPGVLRVLDTDRVIFTGFHIFAGSQNLNAAAIIEAQKLTLDLAERLAREAPGPVTELNIGGGFGIPYFPGEEPLDLASVGASLEALAARAQRTLPQAQLILELGRYLVGEAGYYICRVIDRKVSRGRIYLVTDGGLHHHLAASGNFGQVIRKNYPVIVANKLDAPAAEQVWVVGPLCTPLDLLAENLALPHAVPGDFIAIMQSGAYGFSSSPLTFLSHAPPGEFLV